ncbi:alpha-(1,3)-fucosyltransferase C-like [Uloborus diversus]|uniref:alpha-(1,3)-fucosyltransferase C-like n=1 Tax=Uloborus diversus TaxID=327109 RepID=UPI00240A5E6A|nr:alpha-(1,3)-fucosyltransferase C-like [Uloborus diversus]
MEFLFPVIESEVKRVKRFDNEDARLIGFQKGAYSNVKHSNSVRKLIYLATTFFGEWNPKHYYFLHEQSTTFSEYPCPINNCYASKDPLDIPKADALLFHVRDIEVFSIPEYRAPHQVWILYSMEPPWLEVIDMQRFNGMFNWTMSYRKGSDIPLTYGFIGKKPHNSLKLTKPLTSSDLKGKQNKAVWYVSNCRTDSNREEYVKRLQKVYPVDVVGGCGLEGCRPAETRKCYTKIARNYKFYLAFENAICPSYVTEKLFNSLEYNIIPVTFGGANYTRLVPENSIVNAMEFQSPEELGQYLWEISLNDTRYLSHFNWKDAFRSYLQPWMCDLCAKLHDAVIPRANNDLVNWWHEDFSCLRWSEDKFETIKNYAFPTYHSKTFA